MILRSFATLFYLWPEGTRNPRVGTPSRGIRENGASGASEWPTFLPRSFEIGHTCPRPLESLPGGPESLSGALRGLWEGVSETPNH